MFIFLAVLVSLVIIISVAAGIRALVKRNREGAVLKAPPAKEGEDAPADQPVQRREAVEAAREARLWQAVAAFLIAILSAFGLKQLNAKRKAQEAKSVR